MPKRFTMDDVAKLVGISKATVSRALHAPHLVRPQTRAKIQKAMKKHGYVYDAMAAELSRNRTSIIGLVIPTIRSSIFAKSTIGIQEKAQSEGYAVLIANSAYDTDAEHRMIGLLEQRRVAGLILTGLEPDTLPLVRQLSKRGVPCVVTWQNVQETGVTCVGFDNYKAAFAATEYLISLNHTRIALMCGPLRRVSRVKQRHDAYRAALDKHGIEYDPQLVTSHEYSHLEGKEAMHKLMRLPRRPTAVFAASDVLAMGALAAAWDDGLRVPDDVSVVGYDDVDFAAYCRPPLTTVRVPAYEMGQLAVKVLLEMIGGDETDTRVYTLDTDLVVRASSREFRP